VKLEVHGVMAHITVQMGKNLIESIITWQSSYETILKIGERVSAVIKSNRVHAAKGLSSFIPMNH
jgi:molybdopterin-binding protein